MSDKALIKQSNLCFSEIEKVHAAMSFHESNSELSQINSCALEQKSTYLSQPMQTIFKFINNLNDISDGLFDPTIAPELIKQNHLPMIDQQSDCDIDYGNWQDLEISNNQIHFNKPVLIDLGGIAKGFAVDQAIKCGTPKVSIMVNAGGDIRYTHWQQEKVFIKSPVKNSQKLIETLMTNSAIATSASYYHDSQSVIINPNTLRPIQNEHSVSVFARDCLTADALTKVVWLSPNYQEILTSYNAKALIIDTKNKVIN